MIGIAQWERMVRLARKHAPCESPPECGSACCELARLVLDESEAGR